MSSDAWASAMKIHDDRFEVVRRPELSRAHEGLDLATRKVCPWA